MPGIFLTRGSTLRIPSFTIDLDNIEATTITAEVGFDVYPLWLRSAILQARQAKEVADELDRAWDGSGGDFHAELLEREIVSSMSAIVSASAALDSFYGSVVDRCPRSLQSGSGKRQRRRARERIIISTFQQRFALRNETVEQLRQPLKDLFTFRHIALHAHGRPEITIEHPRLGVGMSRKHVIFRAENAVAATSFALMAIAFLSTRPHHRYPALREHCGYAREWLDPLITDWERDHPTLGLTRPLKERERQRKGSTEKIAALGTYGESGEA